MCWCTPNIRTPFCEKCAWEMAPKLRAAENNAIDCRCELEELRASHTALEAQVAEMSRSRTVYGLAMRVSEGGSHGDPGGSCLGIIRPGSYMSGAYPPLFTTREAAEDYLATLDKYHGLNIIELELLASPLEAFKAVKKRPSEKLPPAEYVETLP